MAADKLEGVHPKLVVRILRILAAMAELGFPMFVTDGVRTLAEQQALYSKGRTAPGPIVTNADGVTNKSNHQAKADRWGYAVDCAFIGVSPWAETHPWELYGAMVRSQGLKWGGNFSTISDKPHAEL